MSKVERCQCGAEIVVGAAYCVQCGMPVYQACPYPACGRSPVSLRTGGKPTNTCPFCRQELLYCPRSGRLHSVYETTSETPGCEDVELVATLRTWPMAGGNPAQSWSVEASSPIAHVPRLSYTERPPSLSPVAAVLVLGGGWVYAHGNSLHEMAMGGADRQCGLTDDVPAESWRLLSHRGRIYAVGASHVDVVNHSAFLRERTISGRCVAQTCTDDAWVGAFVEGEVTALRFVDPSGKLIGNPPLHSTESGDFPRLVADDARVFAGYGSILATANCHGAQEICRIGGEILSLSLVRDLLVSVVLKDGIRVDVRTKEGAQQGDLPLATTGVYRHPVVMDGKLFLIETAGNSIVVIELDPLRVTSQLALPALTTVSAVVGAWYGDKMLLAIAGYEGARVARVLLVDPDTGRSTSVTNDSGELRFVLATTGDKIMVSSSASYENILRVFDVGAYEETD